MRLLAVAAFVLLLSGCGGGEPVVEAEPLRGWDGEILEPGASSSPGPEALASNEAASSTTTTEKPAPATSTVAPKKTTSTTTTTTTSEVASEADVSDLPWSASDDARLVALFADDKNGWSETKISCIAELIAGGSGSKQDRVYELFEFYCDPTGYIDTWSETLTLPTAPNAEECFARVYVEVATSGESSDAAWFIQNRWEPPQPQRDNITSRLTSECGLSEDDWLAAGMNLERSLSWRAFCTELDEVEWAHQRLQAALDDYSLITPPPDLVEEFDAFLTSQQLIIDYIVENEMGEEEYSRKILDGTITSEDLKVSPELEVAWSRFLNVQYDDCAYLYLE